MSCVWCVARVVGILGAYWVLVGQLRDRDHSEDLVVRGRIILKCIFKGQMSKNSPTLTHALAPTFCATDHFEGTNDVPKICRRLTNV